MPAPIIAALIGAAVSGTGMGLQASGALTPSQPDPTKALQQQEQSQQQQLTSMKEQAMRQAAPLAQEQNPFSATDEGTAALIASLAGSPADISLAQQTVFNPAQSSSTSTGSMYNPGLATNVG